VVAECFEQETSTFWKPEILDLIGKKPADVKTEVFLLPAANFAEKDGSFVNSARWIQWKWKAVDPPGDAKPDQEIIARIFLKVRDLYERDGGTLAEPVCNLNWWYTNPASPALDEVLKEINGWAIADAKGRPWDPTRAGIAWNGQKWVGDVPDYTVDSAPEKDLGAFIMLPEGVARLFVPGQFAEGPWSEHYEPAESPVKNPLHPEHSS